LSNKTPIYNKKEIVGIIGISFDITELKETKKKLRNVEAKLEAMTSISSTIAHELRTPLASLEMSTEHILEYLPVLVEGYKEACEKDLIKDKIGQRRLRQFEQIATKMHQEIRYSFTFIDMLLMKIKPSVYANKAVFSIQSCIEDAINRYPFQESERALVHVDKKEDFNVEGDSLLIVHILFNLLKNSLYHISASNKGEIYISLKNEENYNILLFKDTSVGIPQKIIGKIFSQFYSTTQHGSGIGLTFCKNTIESMGGKILCESIDGEYTIILLKFPKG
jgi:signal transduction histidine kinase